MSGEKRQQQTRAADAVREVLEAEAEVRRKVDSCRQAVETELAAEQERARRIHRRAGERLSRIHASCERTVSERAAELRLLAEQKAPLIEPDQADRERLAAAVTILAARLTGGEHG
ncbi:MAG: hypothetical protein EA419_00485 [Wenzhouxiangella sp.]|nr:MAG: hypothetical protein EA419_00485 [Wenzhouxiangella sp.]